MLPNHVDVAIVGGGPVGTYLAHALARQGKSVAVLEKELTPRVDDPRMLAISTGGQQLLSRQSCWSDQLADAPIAHVSVTQRGFLGHTHLHASEIGEDVLGYVVPYSKLHPLLVERLPASCAYAQGVEVTQIQFTSAYALISYQHENTSASMTARLVVMADGGQLATRVAGIEYREQDYHQSALIALIEATHKPEQTALERFLPDGAIALLPRPEGYALIWTAPSAETTQRMALSDEDLLDALQVQVGSKAGLFMSVGQRHQIPLRLRYAKTLVAPRCVVIGNAAQYLHPIAGQGLNLGLRDATDLAKILQSFNDPGAPECLARYPKHRRLDKLNGVGFTDSLIKLFGIPGMGHVRSAGLMALESSPIMKKRLLRHLAYGIRSI
ncbi:FAD-dependent monooxygenase [Leeia oryzae]|uniref:FAD-dependent monooxygenase n=1 Tax=Leeia oryzae TaxID=356662 RepID=UPI00037C98EC|nr:FAD-dependent monooxygenase [Leeia oryzae]